MPCNYYTCVIVNSTKLLS